MNRRMQEMHRQFESLRRSLHDRDRDQDEDDDFEDGNT
jgi:hypothetical protein